MSLNISFPFLLGRTTKNETAITSDNVGILTTGGAKTNYCLQDAIKYDINTGTFKYVGINNWSIGTDGYWYNNGVKTANKATNFEGSLNIAVDDTTIYYNSNNKLAIKAIPDSLISSTIKSKLVTTSFASKLTDISSSIFQSAFKIDGELKIPDGHGLGNYLSVNTELDTLKTSYLPLVDAVMLHGEEINKIVEDLSYIITLGSRAYDNENYKFPSNKLILLLKGNIAKVLKLSLSRQFDYEEEPSLHSFIIVYNDLGYIVYYKYTEDDNYLVKFSTTNINALDADIKLAILTSTDKIVDSSGTTLTNINTGFNTRLNTLEAKPASTTSIKVNDTTYNPTEGVVTIPDYYTKAIADTTFINKDTLGTNNGVALLGDNGKVLSSLLPASLVSPIVEVAELPATGNKDTVYYRTTDGKLFRWTGSKFIEFNTSGGVELGESANTAYYGDKGKLAYEHSLDGTLIGTSGSEVGANPHFTKFSLILNTPTTLMGYGIRDALSKDYRFIRSGLAINTTYRLNISKTILEKSQSASLIPISDFIYLPANASLIYRAKQELNFYGCSLTFSLVLKLEVYYLGYASGYYSYSYTGLAGYIFCINQNLSTAPDFTRDMIQITTGGASTNSVLDLLVFRDGSKVLSSNDYTTAEKNKLGGIEAGATNVNSSTIDNWGYGKVKKVLNTSPDSLGNVDISSQVLNIIKDSSYNGTYNKPNTGIPLGDLLKGTEINNLLLATSDPYLATFKLSLDKNTVTINNKNSDQMQISFSNGTLTITTSTL